MKYITYDSFIDYLFSDDSKSDTYNKLTAWLIKSGGVETFRITNGEFSIPVETVERFSVPNSDFEKSPYSYDCRPSVSNSNGMTSETDKTYQEIFNIPAKENLSECKYINSFVQKQQWNELLKEDESGSSQGSGPRVDNDSDDPAYQTLKGEIPFKDEFDEAEYDSYGIPLDFLNSDDPAVIAEELLKFYGNKITTPIGCLIGVLKNDLVYPIGYIDFENVKPSTRIEIKFDPRGFLQLR